MSLITVTQTLITQATSGDWFPEHNLCILWKLHLVLSCDHYEQDYA